MLSKPKQQGSALKSYYFILDAFPVATDIALVFIRVEKLAQMYGS